jgi:auxin-responsive protein IAA
LCTFTAPSYSFLSFNTALTFVAAQKDLSSAESGQLRADEKIFSQLLNGSGEYTLVYEDNEGDRMLVGDVPWK